MGSSKAEVGSCRPTGRSRSTALAALVLLAATARPMAADWPHRRGPERDGRTVEESGWTAEGWLTPAWTRQVGSGASAPIVVDGVVYALGWQDGRDRVVALEAATGETLWEGGYEAPEYGRRSVGDKGLYSGPSATPEYDTETGLLFTLGIDGDLVAWDPHGAGGQAWATNLYDAFDVLPRAKVGRSGRRDYGYTTSPLALDSALVVEVGAREGNLVAFDKRTGRRQWTSDNRDPAGHTAGPVPVVVDGKPAVAVLTHRGLLVVRASGKKPGTTLATYPWETSFANNIVSPTVYDGTVLLTSHYNHQEIVRLALSRKGVSVLWAQPFASKVGSPVVVDGAVCWSWRKLRCLDLDDGELLWEGGLFGDPGSVVATADGRLIVWGGRGRLALVDGPRRSPDAYTERALIDDVTPADAWPHLALSDGRLFLRDRLGTLRAFALGEGGASRQTDDAPEATATTRSD